MRPHGHRQRSAFRVAPVCHRTRKARWRDTTQAGGPSGICEPVGLYLRGVALAALHPFPEHLLGTGQGPSKHLASAGSLFSQPCLVAGVEESQRPDFT